ncbi:MAG: TonB-dependent receptor [Chitinophagales bacterium]
MRGVITSEENSEPLVGVNIVIKGTTEGTVSDVDGSYSISAPSDATLVYSFVGYTAQEIPISGRSQLDVSMAIFADLFDEIVVVGYGTRKRSDVTGSVVALEEVELREIPVSNPVMALQGRVAGVEIERTSSRPGAGSQIRIRGNRSLGTDESGVNDPLVVLDGIPFSGNINDINPSDIVNMNILKDASATAIYGSRGANGVILVTTRRGSVGKPRLTYNGYVGIASALDKYDLWDAEEYADAKQVSNFGAPGGSFTPTEIENMVSGRSTDWQDVMYRDGYITNHELSVTGGTDKTQYSISAGYFDETTVLPGQEFERFSLRAAIDQKIGERIKIGATMINSVSNRDGENASPMFQILTLSPLYNAYNEDGTINELPAIGSVDANTRSPLTLYQKDSWSQERRRLRTFNNVYGEVEIIEGLKYRLNAGLDYWQDEYGQFYSSNTPFQNGSGSTAAIRNRDSWSYTIENLLLYEKSFGDHNLSFTGLYSAQEEESNRSGVNASAIFADFLQYYNFALAESTTIPNNPNDPAFQYSRWGLLSFMARIEYGYKSKYLATFTIRRDGSSRLAEGNKWFSYPAAALAWNIHNEPFLESSETIDLLKLRLGVGRTSNQSISPYSSLGSLSRIPYNFGPDGGTYGFLVSTLPNAELSWEFTTSRNVGIDFGLFNNRISGSIDVYKNTTEDVLQSRAVPITSGVPGSFQENIGKVEGKGIEVMLSTDIVRNTGDGFKWGLDINFTAHKEEIIELSEGVTQDEGNGWFVGQPVNVIYDYQKIGIWQLGEEELASSFGDFAPGDIKIADLNNNGTIDAEDRTIIGQLDPKWSAGISSRFNFKGFDLSVVAFAKVGGTLVSNLYQMNQGNPFNSLEGRRNGPDVDYWTPNNATNDFPRTGRQITPYGSTVGYFDASYMKIRSINFGYTIPQSVLSGIGLQATRLYFTVNNPFKAFFSDYVDQGGIDPEPNGRANGGGDVIGAAGFGRRLTVSADTPPTRSLILGLNVTL